MQNAEQGEDEHERQLDKIIAEYLQASDEGRPLDQSDVLTQYPEFAAELREFFVDAGQIEKFALPHSSDPDETQPVPDSSSSSRRPGTLVRYFGDYEIIEELGVGGMGVVFKARHTKLNKIIALKMIKMGHLAGDDEVRRFRAEARAAAKLDHPGIVPVHEVGVDHGQPYYTMDYVGGCSLSTLHRDEPVAARRAAEIIKQMAEAMHYAHGQGIVHRDLKPANVILTAGGVPRITDFGLAKRLWSDEDTVGVKMTETGQILGTAGYMSPEQAAGKTRLVGPPADIYALGAVLYALLTSRAPFVGESQADTILQVINKEPVPPRVLNPSTPRDLETVCIKCLEKEPHKRYGTSQRLADDLTRFLENKPVLARPVSTAERGWRWCGRNPWGATALLLLVILSVSSPPIAYKINRQNRQIKVQLIDKQFALEQVTKSEGNARAARKLAESETAAKNLTLYVADMNRMDTLWRDADLGTMRMLLARHLPASGKTDLRDFEWYYWQRKCVQGSRDFVHGRESRLLALSRSGKWLATAGPTDEGSHAIKIWNLKTGQLENTLLQSPAVIVALEFALEESKLIAVRQGNGDFAEIVDWRTGKLDLKLPLSTYAPGAPTSRYAVSPSGKLVARSIMGSVSCLNLKDGKPLSIKLADDANIPSLRAQGHVIYANREGRYIHFKGAAAGITRIPTTTQIQDVPLGHFGEPRDASQKLNDELPLPPEEDGDPVFVLKFSPAEDWLVAGLRHGELIVWDLSTGNEVIKTQSHTSIIWDVAFSADGKQLATASKDGQIKLWEVPSGKLRATIDAHADGVRAVEFSQRGMLVSGGNDHCVKIWSSVTGSAIATFQGHEHAVLDVAIQADGETILSASRDGRVKEWSLSDLAQPIVVANRTPLACLDLFQGGDLVAATGNDFNEVTVWELDTGQIKTNLSGQRDLAFHVRVAPDGNSIVSGTWDGTFTTWDFASGKILAQKKLPIVINQNPMPAVAISPNVRQVAATCPDGKTRIFDLGSGELLATLESETRAISLRFAPNGVEVLTLMPNEKLFDIRLWNAETGAAAEVIATGVESWPNPAFSDDGKWLAWGDLADQEPFSMEIKVWDRSAKEVRQRLPLTADVFLRAIAFSPDHSLLAAIASPTKKTNKKDEPAVSALIVWDVATGRELHHFEESGGALCFLPDGNTIVVAGDSGRVNLWGLAEGRKLRALARPFGPALSVVYSPKTTALKEPNLLVISRSQFPRVGDPSGIMVARTFLACSDPNRQEQSISSMHGGMNFSTVFQPLSDGKLGERGWLKDLLNLDATEVKKLGFANSTIKAVDAYAPEVNLVFVLAPNGTLLKGRANEQGPVIHADAAVANAADAAAMASSFNGRWVALGLGNDIQLWDGDRLELRHTLKGHKGKVRSLAFSRNGDLLATAGSDRSVHLWNTSDGSLRAVLLGHLTPITCLAFSERGGTVFSSSYDGTIRLWDTTTGEAKTTLIGHVGPVHWIDLSPAGDELASAGDDGTIRLWQAPGAVEVDGKLPEPPGKATALLHALKERFAGRVVSFLQPIQ